MVDINMQLALQKADRNMSDQHFWNEELRLCVLADQLGFDAVFVPEHHFDPDYSQSPDNFQILAWLAAKTSRIDLGLGAVILPWNDPLRVAEKINMLDILAPGRFRIGFGRGLAKHEYDTFGIDMATARERRDEAMEMVLEALETGVMEGAGPHYPQKRAVLAPHSGLPYRDRFFEIAMSPDSAVAAGKLGAKLVSFVMSTPEEHKVALDSYIETYREAHHSEPPLPAYSQFTVCHEDAEEARRLGYEHLSHYFAQMIRHYSLVGDHFADTASYKSYAKLSESLQAAGMEQAATNYVEQNLYGTPDEVAEKIRAQFDVLGPFDVTGLFSFGGISYDLAENGMRLFIDQVKPQIEKMTTNHGAVKTKVPA